MSIELLPMAILIFSSVVMVLMIAFSTRLLYCHLLTGMAIVTAFIVLTINYSQGNSSASLLDFSATTRLLCQLSLLIVFIIYWPLHQWLTTNTQKPAPFYLLLHWSLIGTLVMICANHFAIFFIGLELLSLSLIGLIAYQCPDQQAREHAIEAAIKYLILSAIGSAVLLLGFALIYIDSGSLSFTTPTSAQPHILPAWLVSGAMLFSLAGILFKLSLVPCHQWFADILQGAPAPVGALLSTISKLAVFMVLYKLMFDAGWLNNPVMVPVLSFVAIASMLWGNLLALKQQNIFRLLAYSSIAHFGYLLILMLLQQNSSILPIEILGIYLLAYLVALAALFSLVGQISQCHSIDSLSGLFWRQPVVASCLMIIVLSLAGIPLTIGFIAKFYVVLAAVDAGLWSLLAALIIGSVIGLFYYFRLLIVLIKKEQSEHDFLAHASSATPFLPMLVALTILILGIYPEPVIELISTVVNTN